MSSKLLEKKNKPNKNNLDIKFVSCDPTPRSPQEDPLPDDDCGCYEEKITVLKSPGLDPRFQQQDTTLRCYVMYSDFYQCEHLLGEGAEACTWFKDVFQSICPNDWIERWDQQRDENRMPWHKKADFAQSSYGK